MTGAGDEAERVISNDDRIDEADRKVESDAVLLIARRQPMGDDLRVIVSSMRVSQDLERVGDLAKNIAKRALIDRSHHAATHVGPRCRHLSRLVLGQLKRSIEAFVERDTDQGRRCLASRCRDRCALHLAVPRVAHLYDGRSAQHLACTHLLFCAKNWSASAIMRPTSPSGRSTRAPAKWWRPTGPNRMSWAIRTPQTTPRPNEGQSEVSRCRQPF
jgi:phosphate transport system protein